MVVHITRVYVSNLESCNYESIYNVNVFCPTGITSTSFAIQIPSIVSMLHGIDVSLKWKALILQSHCAFIPQPA